MTSALRSANQEEMKLQQFRATVERRNDIELKDLEQRHGAELKKLSETHADQMQRLKQAYDVEISEEAERLDAALHQNRMQNQQRMEAEKLNGDHEFNQARAAHHERIEEFRKNSEAQMGNMQKQLQASSTVLHEQSKKTARKQTEMDNK